MHSEAAFLVGASRWLRVFLVRDWRKPWLKVALETLMGTCDLT